MYNQVGVILFSLIAMLSGARACRQIHALIQARLALLNAAFPAAALRRAPAYTSVRGILHQIDPDELEHAFRHHAEGLDQSCGTGSFSSGPSRFIAIDGKTLRQSFDAFADTKAAHMLSALAAKGAIKASGEALAGLARAVALGLAFKLTQLDLEGDASKAKKRLARAAAEIMAPIAALAP